MIISDPEYMYRHLLSRKHVKLTQTGQVKDKRTLSGVEKIVKKKYGEESFASRIESAVECYTCEEEDQSPGTGATGAEGSGSGS